MTTLDFAIQEIGNEEIPRGSNWGVHVQKYLSSVGINFPASWCMAFCYWCATQAGVTSLIRTGGVLNQWNMIAASHKSSTPIVGSLVIFDHGKGLGHVGIIEIIDGDTLHTIEGNTNDTGSREGYEVCRKQRSVKDKMIRGYIVL